jgi:hypothetical protein
MQALPAKARFMSRKKLVYLPLALLGVLVVLGLAGWYGGALFVEHRFAQWIDNEHGKGRDWSCGSQKTYGFPFTLGVDCSDVVLSGTHAGAAFRGTMPRLTGHAQIGDPQLFILEATAPLIVSLPDQGEEIGATWNTLRGELRFSGGKPIKAKVFGDKLALSGKFGMPDDGTETADRIDINIGVPTNVSHDEELYDLSFAMDGLKIRELDMQTRTSEPANLNGTARLSQFELLAPKSLEERLDDWRSHGGALKVSSLQFTKGNISAQVSGRLILDDSHRLAGELDTQIAGIEPILTRLGIPAGLTAIENLLRRSGTAGQPPPPRGMRLPVALRNGSVYVGPIRTPVRLIPLY